MKQSEPICQHAIDRQAPNERLLIAGKVSLGSQHTAALTVQRGMQLVTHDGTAIGTVAALVLDCQQQAITQLLLCQLPLSANYQRIPLYLIAQIVKDTIHLSTQYAATPTLPLHQPA